MRLVPVFINSIRMLSVFLLSTFFSFSGFFIHYLTALWDIPEFFFSEPCWFLSPCIFRTRIIQSLRRKYQMKAVSFFPRAEYSSKRSFTIWIILKPRLFTSNVARDLHTGSG